MTDIHETLAGKWGDGTRPRDLFRLHVMKNPKAHVATLVAGLRSGNRRIENGCAELCSLLSAERPDLLAPSFEIFRENLKSREAVLRWEAVCTIGNLAACDPKKRIPSLVSVLAQFLCDRSIVLQGHAVKALCKIVQAHPKEAPAIFEKLIASKSKFQGNRIGYLVDALEHFIGQPTLRRRLVDFVTPAAKSDIASVSKKAHRILRLIDQA
jgi:hypothetical protein